MTLLIALGASLGALCRYYMQAFGQQHWPSFPIATVLINLLGSFAIGFLYPWVSQQGEAYRLLINTGFLGGFTTFSAFSLESLTLLQRGDYFAAFTIIFISTLGGLALCFMGQLLGLKCFS